MIAQGCLKEGAWRGYADFLLKVGRPSVFGPWSYEVADTKLSATTRGSAVLQLCLYTEILGNLQKANPEFMWVIKPADEASREPSMLTGYELTTTWLTTGWLGNHFSQTLVLHLMLPVNRSHAAIAKSATGGRNVNKIGEMQIT